MSRFHEVRKKCIMAGMKRSETELHLWNEAYLLGRRRWYWGPLWMSDVVGWLNTRRYRIAATLAVALLIAVLVWLVNLVSELAFPWSPALLTLGLIIGVVAARYWEER